MATFEAQPDAGDRELTLPTSVQLAMLGRYADQLIRDALSAHGLKPRQLQILDLLAVRGPTGQRELGDTLAIDHSILVTLLNPMEAGGLVERQRSYRDRRRHVVTLTDAGRRRHTEGFATLERVEQSLFDSLSAEDQRQFVDLLAVVGAAAVAQHGGACDAG